MADSTPQYVGTPFFGNNPNNDRVHARVAAEMRKASGIAEVEVPVVPVAEAATGDSTEPKSPAAAPAWKARA
jgi:hypothetical protein